MKLVDIQGCKPCPLQGPGSTPGGGNKSFSYYCFLISYV